MTINSASIALWTQSDVPLNSHLCCHPASAYPATLKTPGQLFTRTWKWQGAKGQTYGVQFKQLVDTECVCQSTR